MLRQEGRPVAFESARFNPAEKNYTIGEQELLAVIHALKKWRVYLEGSQHPVKLKTDHQPLTYLPTKGTLGSRQVRWAEYLARFDIEWEHIAGHKNIADVLSRKPCLSLYVTTRSQAQQATDAGVDPSGETPAGSPISRKSHQKVERELRDEELEAASPISPRVERDRARVPDEPTPHSDGTERQGPKQSAAANTNDTDEQGLDEKVRAREYTYLQQIRDAYQHDVLLKFKNFRRKIIYRDGLWWRPGGENIAMYIPQGRDKPDALRLECIQWVHDHPFGGHVGMYRTQEILRRDFWWPKMDQMVVEYVGSREMCNRNKAPNRKPKGLLQPLPIPGRPWESIGMDFITHLPMTNAGHTALYVVIDRLTKLTHIVPTTDGATAPEVADMFINAIVRHHGLPREIISDRDVMFTSKFWEAFSDQVGIKMKMSSAYHPQTDGQTERMNRVIIDMIRHNIDPTHNDWDEHLAAVEFAINNAYQQSIGTTPFRLTYGQHPLTPASLRTPKIENPTALQVTGELQQRIQRATRCLQAAQQRQKAYADKSRRHVSYEPSDEVLLSTENVQRTGIGTPKFMPLWIGPFKIVRKVEETAYELELAAHMKMHDVFHVSLLKPYNAAKHGVVPVPPTLTLGKQQEFEVQSVLGERTRKIKHPRKGKPTYTESSWSHGEDRTTRQTHGSQIRI